MKREIIEIVDISRAIPKYKVWYKYYNDIFVSVIYNNNTRKSHLRIKKSSDKSKSKTDNKMCFWHSDWQYAKFEKKYGLPITGLKTYEISKVFDDEIHRIDSLIENVAIEFQHTLEVSVNEMDLRYTAHKGLNYIPYLVLDLTDYPAKETLFKISSFSINNIDYHIEYSSEMTSIILKKIRKWTNSKYFRFGNLFIDFSDTMVRFTPKLRKEYLPISKKTFLDSILNLEQIINDELKNEKDELEQKIRNEREKEKEEKRQKEIKYFNKVKNNKFEITNTPEYKYYRYCLVHPKIKKIITSQKDVELVKHREFIIEKNQHLKKSHIYSLFQSASSKPILELHFTLNYDINSSEYLFSEIFITQEFGREGIIVLEFIQDKGERIRKTSKKLELARDFLHSTTHHAKYNYDINEKLISKEYYLFNKKVSNQEFNDLCFYFEYGVFLQDNLYSKYEKLINELTDYDEYGLISGFCQNLIHESSLNNYYKDKEQWQPLSEKNEW